MASQPKSLLAGTAWCPAGSQNSGGAPEERHPPCCTEPNHDAAEAVKTRTLCFDRSATEGAYHHGEAEPDTRSTAEDLARNVQIVLAADRTMLAIERTYAAWVRTGLAALASGVATRAFVDTAVPRTLASIMASLLLVFSGFCFVAGVWRELRQFKTAVRPGLRGVPTAILVGANAVMMLVSFTALIGVWTAG